MIKELLEGLSEKDVEFTKHAIERMEEYSFEMNSVLKTLFDLESLELEEKENGTYKLTYLLSGKYRMVIVIAKNSKIRIVTTYKTSKKIDKLIKKSKNIISYVKRE